MFVSGQFRFTGAVGDLVTRGVAGGLSGGVAFAIANMYYADAHGKPAVAPFLAIATIFHHQKMPMMSPENVVTGLVLHVALSMVFGVVFALVVVPVARGAGMLVAGGVAYGLVLFVVNFEIFGRAFFPWFTNPKGPNQLFELWIHPVAYGLFLVPFFLGIRHAALTEPAASPASPMPPA